MPDSPPNIERFLTPPEPPRPFVGRRRELEQLEDLVYGRERSYGRPIVIMGEAGVGKTAITAEFVARQSRRRTLWISARDWEPSILPFERILRDRMVEAREATVVIDGADEIGHDQFFDAFRRITNFKLARSLIVTSRTDSGVRGQQEMLLERFPVQDSESLIRKSLSIAGLGEDDLGKIVTSVNGHPLAIGFIAKMARAMAPEQLRQVLKGHLYDIKDTAPAERKELIAVAKPIIVSANEAMIAALKRQPDDVFKLTPREYEELIAELLHDMGYDVTLTQATRDGGKDIIASIKTECGEFLCLVEAKKYRQDRTIGVSLVRTLYGTLHDYQANSGMLVTTSAYSKDAHAFQKRHQYQLSLRDYTDVATWIQKYGTKRPYH
jgi:restriction system protein